MFENIGSYKTTCFSLSFLQHSFSAILSEILSRTVRGKYGT
jgi:hypothetical protein